MKKKRNLNNLECKQRKTCQKGSRYFHDFSIYQRKEKVQVPSLQFLKKAYLSYYDHSYHLTLKENGKNVEKQNTIKISEKLYKYRSLSLFQN